MLSFFYIFSFFVVVVSDADAVEVVIDPTYDAPNDDLSDCECADILASVFPQLVRHWNAAGNKLKTFR